MFELFERLIALLKQGTLPVMLPLVLVCLGIGILTVDRVLYLYDPRAFVSWCIPGLRRRLESARSGVQERLEAFVGAPTREARVRALEACDGYRTPYTRFVDRVLRSDFGGVNGVALDLEIESAVLREELAIERGMRLLSTFAKAAPLMGLMGTVTGMIATFAAMMVASTSDPRALSSGISIALTATNVGLVVSLPGVVSMGMLSRRGQTMLERIRLASMQIRGIAPDQLKGC